MVHTIPSPVQRSTFRPSGRGSVSLPKIEERLPHRAPFLFVERILELTPGESAVGEQVFDKDEPFFKGHFPGNPVVPGVLMVEALAQLCCVLATGTLDDYSGQSVYLLAVNDTRFRRMVRPDETLTLYSKIIKHRRNMWFFKAKAYVGDELAVETSIKAALGDE